MSLLVGGILRHKVHKGRIASLVWTWCFAHACMFEIEAVATTPLPGVIEIEHGYHLTLTHLHEKVVESGEDGVVIDARGFLQSRLHLGGDALLSIGTYEDSKIINTHGLEVVELADKPLTVSSLPFGAEDCTIPEICTYIVIRFPVTKKMTVLHLYERGRNVSLLGFLGIDAHADERHD